MVLLATRPGHLETFNLKFYYEKFTFLYGVASVGVNVVNEYIATKSDDLYIIDLTDTLSY
jgi:hypothetical protein